MPHWPAEDRTTDAPRRVLRLSVENVVAAIEAARLQVLEYAKPDALTHHAIYNLELVLEEALMNRVLHAFPAGTRHHTAVTFEVLPDALVLSFEDDGVAFDPTQAVAPKAGPATIGGLGLQLTRKAARAIRYQRIDGRNRTTIELARD